MFSQSTPSLLFNAQSMKDLLQGTGTKVVPAKGGKIAARLPATQSMSASLIQSILRQETGDPKARMAPPQKKKKRRADGITSSQSGNQVIESDVNPLERARTMRKVQNSVHAFAPIFAVDNDISINGDDVSYLERQYSRIGTIVEQNAKKIADGYEQLMGEMNGNAIESDGGIAGSSKPFTIEDANLLLLFTGITEIDDDESAQICQRSLLRDVQARMQEAEHARFEREQKMLNARQVNNMSTKLATQSMVMTGDDTFMKAAQRFVEAEEAGESGINAVMQVSSDGKQASNDASVAVSVPPTTKRVVIVDNPGKQISKPTDDELSYSVWVTGVLAVLRQKLLAGVLAEKRGQLPSNFIDLAEQSSVAMHALAPARKHGRAPPSRPGSSESMIDDEGDSSAHRVDFDGSLSNLFADYSVEDGPSTSLLDPNQSGYSLKGGLSKSGKGSKSMLDAGAVSFFNQSQASLLAGQQGSGLPPLQIRKSKSLSKLKQLGSKKSVSSLSKTGFHDSQISRAAGKSKIASSGAVAPGGLSTDDIAALRAELQRAQEGLAELDQKVDKNIAWVHNNCDTQGIAISDRTKERCRKMALERLFQTIHSYLQSSLSYALHRWHAAVRFDEVSRLAIVYGRAKALEKFTNAFSEALSRQYLKVWTPWHQMFAIQKRWEQETASMEIGRVIRGFNGRRKAWHKKRHQSCIKIQCMARSHRARKRVINRRKYLRLFRAAKCIQEFFRFLVLRTKARAECQRRRDLRAAKELHALQRRQAENIKRQAEEKLRAEKAALKKKANAATQAEGSKGRKAPKQPASPTNTQASPPQKASAGHGKVERTASAKKAPATTKTTTAAKPASASGAGRKPVPTPINTSGLEFMQPSNNTAPDLDLTAPAPYNPMNSRKKKTSPVKEPEPEFDFDAPTIQPENIDIPAIQRPVPRSHGELSRSPGSMSSSGPFGDSDYGMNHSGPLRGPIITKEDALRMKEEAEKFLIESDPEYAAMVRKRDEFFASGRAAGTTSPDITKGMGEKKSSSGSLNGEKQGASKGLFSSITGGLFGSKKGDNSPVQMAEEEDEEYLTPEQVAEQDRQRAIELEARIKREKEEAYIAAQDAKQKEIADAAQRKADALAAKDRAEFEKAEAIRRAKEEAEEAKRKALEEAEERKRQKAETERLAKEAKEKAKRDAEEEKAKAIEMLKQRERDIQEAKAKAKAELAAEIAASQKANQKPETPRPLSARLMDGFRSILTPRTASPSRPGSAVKGAANERENKTPSGTAVDSVAEETQEFHTPKKDRPENISTTGSPITPALSRPASAINSFLTRAKSGLNILTNAVQANLPGADISANNPDNTKHGANKTTKGLTPIKVPVRVRKFDPATAKLIPQELAIKRIQCQARRLKAVTKISKQRELIMKEQARAGRYIVWAVVLIQRTARGRQGRQRFKHFKYLAQKAKEELRLRSCVKIQCAARRRLACKRCKRLWIEKGEKQKAAEWKKYQADTNRKAKIKLLAQGTPRKKHDSDEEDTPDITTWGIDPEQVQEIDLKIRRLEEIEKSIEKKELDMKKQQQEAEKRSKDLEMQLKKLEEKQKADEAARLTQMEMLKQAMGSGGPMQTGRSMMSTGGRGGGRGPMSARTGTGPTNGRNSVPSSARHSAPPTARSAREGAGIPPDAPRKKYEGQEWVQLFDPDEKAVYWYCEATQAAQWHEPGTAPEPYYDSGYDTEGAMTDYSTDYYSGAETDYSGYQTDSVWAEYWDESAQAKYWYNNETGEASWTRPESLGAEGGGALAGAYVPQSAREFPDEWVSYIDEATNQEYWYNSKTGETSWA